MGDDDGMPELAFGVACFEHPAIRSFCRTVQRAVRFVLETGEEGKACIPLSDNSKGIIDGAFYPNSLAA